MNLHAQPRLDPHTTLGLAQASLAAYADYEKKTVVPPPNFRLVARWTGWDDTFLAEQQERFGLLFQCALPGRERTFMFAFRGTDSDMDAFTEAQFETTPFQPDGGSSPNPAAQVSSGFYGIYNNRGNGMTHSMREQLFALLDRYQPKRVYITGHSLGAALAELFTLDMAISRPSLWAACLNFSCPMVGTDDWKQAYESQAAQKDPARRTIRAYNYWDIVPTMPPSIFGYEHVGDGFRTSFYVRDALYPHIVSRHSLLNLNTVLSRALYLDPQAWTGTFTDASNSDLTMFSTQPPVGMDTAWSDRARERLDKERELLPGDALEPGPDTNGL